MSKLIGGQAFTITCTLISRNKKTIQLSALVDCGANGYCFIDRGKSRYLRKKGKALFAREKLPELPINGFDGQPANPISRALIATLVVDDTEFSNNPFFEVDIGTHDLILGRVWLAEHDALPDC